MLYTSECAKVYLLACNIFRAQEMVRPTRHISFHRCKQNAFNKIVTEDDFHHQIYIVNYVEQVFYYGFN